MTHLELTGEELRVLTEVLEHSVSDLSIEIFHTDNAEFKDKLKQRKVLLDGLLAKMRQAPALA